MVATLALGEPAGAQRTLRRWAVTDASQLSAVRHELAQLLDGTGRASDPRGTSLTEVSNRLALSFSELTSNALRHGAPPVVVQLLEQDDAVLIDVADGAPQRTPAPTTGRTLGEGGYGLFLVGQVSSHCGWYVSGPVKHVWARITFEPPPELAAALAAVHGEVSATSAAG